MNLVLQRMETAPEYTIGELRVDGQFLCWTLEDPVRDLGPDGSGKIPGKTAIPAGTYDLGMRYSPRFRSVLPHLKNVPFFEWILIHAGNLPHDTEGCILVGLIRGKGSIGSSRAALKLLIQKLTLPATIEILNRPA